MFPPPLMETLLTQFKLLVTVLLETWVEAVLFWTVRFPLTLLPTTCVGAVLLWSVRSPATVLLNSDVAALLLPTCKLPPMTLPGHPEDPPMATAVALFWYCRSCVTWAPGKSAGIS